MYLFCNAWSHPATYSVVPCFHSPGLKWAGCEADIPHIVPTQRMCGAVPTFRSISLWRAQEQIKINAYNFYLISLDSFVCYKGTSNWKIFCVRGLTKSNTHMGADGRLSENRLLLISSYR
jgi:hypothetical protein